MFREEYGLTGTPVYGDKPDVIIQEGGRRIGIEITNFFLKAGDLPESEQRQRFERQNLVEHAQRSYLAHNGKKFELTFTFNDQHPILDRAKVANAVVTLARAAEGEPTGQLRRDLIDAVPQSAAVWLNAKEREDAKWRVA
jgi:hypothetical protein